MTKGWRFEPARHSLASQGVKTSHAKNKVQQFHNALHSMASRGIKSKYEETSPKKSNTEFIERKIGSLLFQLRSSYGRNIGLYGNCGQFAIALKHFIEKVLGDNDAELVAIYEEEAFEDVLDEDEEWDDIVSHVMVKWNGKFWDIEGEQDFEDIMVKYSEHHPHQEIKVEPINEKVVLQKTSPRSECNLTSIEDYEKLFLKEEYL